MRSALALAIIALACGPEAAPPPPPPAPVVEPAPPPPPPPPPERAGPLGSYHGIRWVSPSPQGNALRGVAVLGPSLVVAVGDRGTILRWDGTAFALEDAPGRERLEDVWGDDPLRAWAVGESGTILRRGEDTRWAAEASGTSETLHAIWGRGGELWAAGDGGVILHRPAGASAAWTSEPSGTTSAIADVWGDASTVYALAVSAEGAATAEATLLSRTDAGWTTLSTLAGDLAGGFSDGAGHLTLVGADARHGDGSRWSRETLPGERPLDSAWGAEGIVLAAGYDGRIARWDGHDWELEALPVEHDVLALAGTSATDAWAVGAHGLVAHLSGAEWTVLSSGSVLHLEGVHGTSATDVWAVGQGVSLHFDGTAWSPLGPADAELESCGGSGTDVFAVGGESTIHHLALGTWTTETSPTTSKLESVWSDATGHAFAVGGGAFLERAGGTWSALEGRGLAHSVWGAAPDDVWAVGDGIEHFDGATWAASPSPAGHVLFGVWADGPRDAWAVGEGGTILHYDGTSWTASPSPTSQDLVGVWGSGPDDVWAVGRHGTVVRWDGREWRWRDSGTDELLHAVWGTGSEDVWIVGHGGVILHGGGA